MKNYLILILVLLLPSLSILFYFAVEEAVLIPVKEPEYRIVDVEEAVLIPVKEPEYSIVDVDDFRLEIDTTDFDLNPFDLGLHTDIVFGAETVVITDDGRVLWKGREVETDEDFKKAMLDMYAILQKNLSILSNAIN